VLPRIMCFASIDQARRALRSLSVERGELEELAHSAVHRCVLLEDISLQAALVLKQEMLARGGQVALPASAMLLTQQKTSALLMGTVGQFLALCQRLGRLPFGLAAIAESLRQAILGSCTEQRYVFQVGEKRFPLGERTYVMGIINMTPDSFSGDGLAGDAQAARRQAEQFIEAGADLLDIGGQSTRPGSEPVSAEEELRRVLPAVEAIAPLGVPISIDTDKAEVARAALDCGAQMINDITALAGDPEMLPLAAERGAAVCLMHMQGRPRTMQNDPRYERDVVLEVAEFLAARCREAMDAGVPRERILVDPGIGFGKTVEHNLELLNRLDEIRAATGCGILVGTSRKSFIGAVLNLDVRERLEGTAASVTAAIARGADWVRVHDAKEMVRVCRMSDAILRRNRAIG